MLPPTHVSTWRPLPKWFPLCGLIFLTPSFFFSSLHLLYPINLFILQDSDRTVPVAFLALPDLDLYCLILEHLPDFSVITSTPTSRPRPSLDQPHSRRLVCACRMQGQLASSAPGAGFVALSLTLLGEDRGAPKRLSWH